MGKARIARSMAVVFGAALLWPLMTAVPASAAPCGNGGGEVFLVDSAGWPWDLDDDGSVSNGLGDAFDGFPDIEVGGSGFAGPVGDTCTHEDGGREITYPEEVLDGLQVSRKVFVPATGSPIARFLTLLRNDTAAPVTTTYLWEGNLGSNGSTAIQATSSGDATAAVGDVWAVSHDTDDTPPEPEDPVVLQVWAGAAPGAPQGIASIDWPSTGDDSPEVNWDVTVPPGATFVFMHLVGQRLTVGGAQGDAAVLSTSAPDPFVGMSATELSQLRNWVLPVCRGKTATLFGTSANDTLSGTADDVVLAGGGNDTVSTGSGKDNVCAGDGNDKVNGGGGKDFILGQAGNDRMNGGPGSDTCKGGPGKDKAKACEKGKA